MILKCIKPGYDFAKDKIYEVKNEEIIDDIGYHFSFYELESFNNIANWEFEEVKEFKVEEKAEWIYSEQEKKEGNYMKILNIYENREKDRINKEYNDNRDKIIKGDKNLKEYYKIIESIKNYNKKLQESNINYGVTVYSINTNDFLTQKSKDEIEAAEQTFKIELESINNIIEEVEAQLEICETQESKISVLKSYGILNEEGRIKGE